MSGITGLTEKDPSNEGVCVVAVLVICDIAETDKVQLLLASTASCVHREQNGPCDQAPKEAEGDGNFEVAQEEEGVEGVVVEHVAVRNLIERANPIEKSTRQIWSSLSIDQLLVDAHWMTQMDYMV